MKKRLIKSLLALAFLVLETNANAQTILLSENFSADSMPAGWSQDSAGVMPFFTWSFTNPGAKSITGAGFDTSFVIFDSDNYGTVYGGSGVSEDAYLNLPTLNASALSSLYLIMDEQYQNFFGDGFHQIEISNDGGLTYTGILSDSDSTSIGYPNPAVHSVYNITAWGAGQATVNIRFHYAALWAWWWAIDNVVVSDFVPCFAGTAMSSDLYSCGTDSFTLDLTGGSGGGTFQWQSSPDGITWTNIPGATTIPVNVSQAALSSYRAVFTCNASVYYSSVVTVPYGPPAGEALATSDQLCDSTVTFDLSLDGASPDPGLTRQWQSSTDFISWTGIAGQTDSMYTGVTQSVSTFYRCLLSCGSAVNASTPVYVQMNQNAFCYCFPLNPSSCTGIDNITHVSISGTSLNNYSYCDTGAINAYQFFSPLDSTSTANLTRNTTYTFSVTTNNSNSISIWIDYDRNGVFDTYEWTQVCQVSVPDSANTVSVTIPGTAGVGPTGMRVRSRLSGNPNDSTYGCLFMGSGETEDYVIGIEFTLGMHAYSRNGVSLFPNPTNGILNMVFSDFSAKTNVGVYDILGNCMSRKEFSDSYRGELDLSAFANGVYFVKIENAKGLTTQKIILNR